MHRDRDATVRARGAVPLGDTDDGSDGSVSTGAGQLDTGSDLNGDEEQGRYWQRRGTSVTSEVGSTSDAEAVQSEIEVDGCVALAVHTARLWPTACVPSSPVTCALRR